MKEIILIKNGELALKGLNRNVFEDCLIKNLRQKLAPLGETVIKKAQSTIYIEPTAEDFDFEEALVRTSKVFGIAAFSRAAVCEKNIDEILKTAPVYLADIMKSIKTFKVEAKRADKRFPLTSPEIAREVGGALLSAFRISGLTFTTPTRSSRLKSATMPHISEQDSFMEQAGFPSAPQVRQPFSFRAV